MEWSEGVTFKLKLATRAEADQVTQENKNGWAEGTVHAKI